MFVERSPLWRASHVSSVHYIAYDRCEFGEIRSSLHVGIARWVFSHGIEVGAALPLRVIHHVPSVSASVDVGRDESWHVLHDSISGLDENVDEFLLVLGGN